MSEPIHLQNTAKYRRSIVFIIEIWLPLGYVKSHIPQLRYPEQLVLEHH